MPSSRKSGEVRDMLRRQGEFSSLFFDVDELTVREKEEMTKSFALALHAEVSSLVSGVNFRDHRPANRAVDVDRILYESIDAMRYVMAIINLWGIPCDDVVRAFWDKDAYLWSINKMESKKRLPGQQVILFDIDDVLADFRRSFHGWMLTKHGVAVDSDSREYYNTSETHAAGLNNESLFKEFIADRKLRSIPVVAWGKDAIDISRRAGLWIQLVTARPHDNLVCLYDTFRWLKKNDIYYDSIEFTSEKFRWLMEQSFYADDCVVCAVDDASKNVSDYVKHGVTTIMPTRPYNADAPTSDRLISFDEGDSTFDMQSCIDSLVEKNRVCRSSKD